MFEKIIKAWKEVNTPIYAGFEFSDCKVRVHLKTGIAEMRDTDGMVWSKWEEIEFANFKNLYVQFLKLENIRIKRIQKKAEYNKNQRPQDRKKTLELMQKIYGEI